MYVRAGVEGYCYSFLQVLIMEFAKHKHELHNMKEPEVWLVILDLEQWKRGT